MMQHTQRNLAALIFCALFIVGTLYHSALIFRPDDCFYSRPYVEDAFYSLSVARSIGHGHGLTFDGVHKTNGVQPLICFLDAPFFAIAPDNDFIALRLVMLLQIILYGGASLAVGSFAVSVLKDKAISREVFWFAAALVTWSYTANDWLLDGLETGLAMLFTFAAVSYYNRRIASLTRPALGSFAVEGLLLGLGVLSRIDISFLVAVLVGWHLLRAHRMSRSASTNDPAVEKPAPTLTRTLIECVVMGGVSVLVSAPWWLYNYLSFGSVMPISGQSQAILDPNKHRALLYYLKVVSDAFMIIAHTPYDAAGIIRIAGILAASASIVVLLILPGSRKVLTEGWKTFREEWNLPRIAPMLFYCLALSIFYVFFFGTPTFISRYMEQFSIVIALGFALFIFTAWRRSKNLTWVNFGGIGLLTAAVCASSVFFMRNFGPDVPTANIFVLPARWILAHTKPTDRVAMYQSGTSGFMCKNVINLDGKVNPEAHHARVEGRMPQYVDSLKLDYILDLDEYTYRAFKDPVVRAHYQAVDTIIETYIAWKRVN